MPSVRRSLRLYLTCTICCASYSVYARRADSRFCSVDCKNVGRRHERKTTICKGCQKTWEAKCDHSVWPKFCSRRCFLSVCVRPELKACESCGIVFRAGRSSTSTRGDGRRLYCSTVCAGRHQRKRVERQCHKCHVTFVVTMSRDDIYCSATCRYADLRREKHSNWRGGKYLYAQTDNIFVYRLRPDRIAKYEGEHRLIAARIIGRVLEAHEYVIRCSREPSDNDPDNLFICASRSEFAKRRNGSLPWPTQSNLDEWRNKSVRPLAGCEVRGGESL